MDLVLSVSPNNLITVGIQSLLKCKKQKGDNTEAKTKTRLANHYGNSQLLISQGYTGGIVENHYGLKSVKVLHKGEVEQYQEAKSRSLDIIREVQSTKNGIKKGKDDEKFFGIGKPGFGRLSSRSTKFTKLARNRFLSAGSIISRKTATPSHSTFVTLTVPGNASGVAAIIARWSSYIANRTLQGIRNAKRSGINCEYFYSWELQKRGMLHLHLVIFSPTDGESYSVAQNVASRWFDALKSLAEYGHDVFAKRNNRECWLPQYWQADIKPVQKSVAAYISKYVSKSTSKASNTVGSSSNVNNAFQPPRWWGMSRNLLGEIKRLSARVVIEGLTEDDCSRIAARICEKLMSSSGLVQSQNYSFEVDYGRSHIGNGFRWLFYLSEGKYDYYRRVLGNILCCDISDLSGSFVTGNNWLYQQAKGLPVACPEFSQVSEA